MNALVLLADGFEDIEAVTVVDVLRRGGVVVKTASISDSPKVMSAHSVGIEADVLFNDVEADTWDAVILPGGGEGTENLKRCDKVISRLQRQKDEGRLICAICAAPTVLVEAEVLDEVQNITCYPSCVMDLDREPFNAPVVVDGSVITGQGPGASLLFALVILQALEGESVARKVARGMITDVLDT